MKIAVVGVTGMVGQVMLSVLEERGIKVSELIPVASERSVGKQVGFGGKQVNIVSMQEAIAKKPEIALFSAGGDVSREFAPAFAKAGTIVIDNSSAFRMDDDVPLVVPEINADHIRKEDKIIANPNCSTIQLVMALAPIHKQYRIRRGVISTYQSITGTGKAAMDQLEAEKRGEQAKMAYPYKIMENALPHCDVFDDEGYTREERKLEREPLKILSDSSMKFTATAVRIPTMGGHSEAVNLELEKPFEIADIRALMHDTPGVVLQDNPDTNTYPMPLTAHNKDDVFVGRIRRDKSQESGLHLWIVADNLRKGAATNAVQIAEYLIDNKFV